MSTSPALTARDWALLDRLQAKSFAYFVHEVNPANGLIADKSAQGWPASIAAVGMALTAYPVAVERGLLSREQALERTLVTLRFFSGSRQGGESDATGYRGLYYHWLDMATGRRAWTCELSTVDSAILFAGMLTAAAYFEGDDPKEQEVRDLTDALYRRADWRWALNGGAAISHGWKPGRGFLRYRWQGYDEALLLYALALGSPTFGVPTDSYAAFTSTYEWRAVEGLEQLYAGPLFIHQLSHLWIDFRGIQDDYTRGKGIDYFENSRRATLAQQRYAVRNPRDYPRYGERCWGITASDGPGPARRTVHGKVRRYFDYVARGIPDGPDDGTLAPWAAAASLPFASEIVLPTLHYFSDEVRLEEGSSYGYKATFNPSFRSDSDGPFGWVSPWHYGINQGPIILMIENFRNELVWRLLRRSPWIAAGLRRAGFAGGWLDQPDQPALAPS